MYKIPVSYYQKMSRKYILGIKFINIKIYLHIELILVMKEWQQLLF